MKKIGLALGSGGVRGLAHIGVLKVLEEENIKPDIISGTSIGAVIGAMYASGKTSEDIRRIVDEIDWKKLFKLADITFGKGIFRGNKFKKFLKENVGAGTFKELKIPLVVVATDTNTGEAVEITSGDLADALRASISIPFVFTPVKLDNHTCVDGALSQPVPVQSAINLGAEKIIAVDLDAVYFKKSKGNKYFKVNSTAINTINLLRYHLAKANTKFADVVITPNPGRVYWNKFVKGGKIIDSGEDAARAVIDKLRRL